MSDFPTDGNLSNEEPERSTPAPDLQSVRLIVAEIKQGNDEAWSELANQINGYLNLMAERNLPEAVRGQANASDIVQQTMMEVVKGIGGFQGQTTPEFFAWLNQILRNQSMRFARDLTRQKRDVRRQVSIDNDNQDKPRQIDLPDGTRTPKSEAIARERLELMDRALQALVPEHERVIRLRNLDELSYEQIASQMNRSVGAVTKLWYRAMVKLRQALESLENETRQ